MISHSEQRMAADMEIEMSATIPTNETETTSSSLLSCVKSLVKLEQSLTQSLSTTRPLLSLSTPQTSTQINTILALARTYSTRTSAPPGWNPNLPVLHFSTPNPLPHQLRQGMLGAMELQLVKEERVAKRRKIEEEQQAKRIKLEAMQKDGEADPKKKEVMEHDMHENQDRRKLIEQKKRMAAVQKMNEEKEKSKLKKKAAVSMNLSDSSSSDDESDSDSD